MTTGRVWVLVILLTAFPLTASQRIEGIVLDSDGAVVENAQVRVAATGIVTRTNASGSFALDIGEVADGVLEITAPGFLPASTGLRSAGGPLHIILRRNRMDERLTVTAARTPMRLDATPASIVVMSREALQSGGAVTLDDALRQVPGFTLFRRSGSRVANPTTQGVSLRGVGASGAGRALVLDDGIPLNDPFGGWIYWGRVPREALRQVEVLRGGGSDLYGSGALGGVIHLVRREDARSSISAQGSYGDSETSELSLFIYRAGTGWRWTAAAEAFDTAGYTVVPDPDRGPVDTPADSERTSIDVTLERRWSADLGRTFLRGSRFDEERGNGTALQTNETEVDQVSLGSDLLVRNAHIGIRAYGSTQYYLQSFSAIAADRSGETLTRLQRVPSEASGVSMQVVKEVGSRHRIVGGVDLRKVKGRSDERGFGFSETFSSAGGSQSSTGLFLEDVIRVSDRLTVTAALRLDRWSNHDASRTQGVEIVDLVSRDEDAFSPRISVHHRLDDRLTIAFSAYRAFRAPTLNELYRGFRVGNVVTDANESLGAETLTGLEAGLVGTSRDQRARIRAMLFQSDVDDPIANVTRSVTPSLITRQRQNLGSTRSRGIELDGEIRPWENWSLSAGYLYVDSDVTRSPGAEELVGLSLPQVPENQATFQARYRASSFSASLQARWSDNQFDDDRNLFRLESYFAIDALVSRSIGHGVEILVAGENLTDEQYETGRTPVATVGPSRSLRVGLRVRWPAS